MSDKSESGAGTARPDAAPSEDVQRLVNRVADKLTAHYYLTRPGLPLGSGNDPDVAALRSVLAERDADKARLDWLQENAYQLSTTDQGETCDARWEVFPNAVDLCEDADVPSGKGIRAAIDAAMSAAVAPAARETQETNDGE